jgi:hypothetical protein
MQRAASIAAVLGVGRTASLFVILVAIATVYRIDVGIADGAKIFLVLVLVLVFTLVLVRIIIVRFPFIVSELT